MAASESPWVKGITETPKRGLRSQPVWPSNARTCRNEAHGNKVFRLGATGLVATDLLLHCRQIAWNCVKSSEGKTRCKLLTGNGFGFVMLHLPKWLDRFSKPLLSTTQAPLREINSVDPFSGVP
jgi:hypothetical protein